MKYQARLLDNSQVALANTWTELIGQIAEFWPWFETTPAMTAAIDDLELHPLESGSITVDALGIEINVAPAMASTPDPAPTADTPADLESLIAAAGDAVMTALDAALDSGPAATEAERIHRSIMAQDIRAAGRFLQSAKNAARKAAADTPAGE